MIDYSMAQEDALGMGLGMEYFLRWGCEKCVLL